MLDFTNKTVIITGASRGIGEASAHYFSDLNANVVLAARSKNKIEEIANKLGKNALAIECDVADPSQVNDLMMKSSKAFGTIDVLINNAGIIDPIQRIEHSDPVAWGQLIDINLKGLYYGIRYALPLMKSKSWWYHIKCRFRSGNNRLKRLGSLLFFKGCCSSFNCLPSY